MSGLGVTLRSVLFHSVSDTPSAFTDGLGVTMAEDDFRSRVAYLRRCYQPVGLDAVRAAAAGERLPPRALLVTIDDAYSSVADRMAGVLDDAGIPSIFFVNGAFVDHHLLGTDNLVAYTFNTLGGAALQQAATETVASARVSTIDEALRGFVPRLDQPTLRRFRDRLIATLDHDPLDAARDEHLYLDRNAVQGLPESMAIGSHTSTHVRGRTLSADDFGPEITDNRTRLEEMTSRPVDAFSVPYGSMADVTPGLAAALAAAGHDFVFLVEGQLNHGSLRPHRMFRVSLKATTDLGSRLEIEVWPRIRRLRDLVTRR